MQFNGHSDKQDLCTFADIRNKTDDNDYPLTEKAMHANTGLREILSWILSVYGAEYDDGNQTTLPSYSAALVADQSVYPLPDLVALEGVAVKLEGSVSWQRLNPITLAEIQSQCAEAEFMRTSGSPLFYRPIGDGIKVYPAPSYSQAASLKIELQRDSLTFVSTDTVKEPGFDTAHHEAVGVFMALQFSKINGLDNAVDLQREFDGNEEVTKVEGGFKKRIKAAYRRKFVEHRPSIRHRPDIVSQYV